MKPLKISEKSHHRLLVEGKDDLHTIIHLLRRHSYDYDAPQPSMPYIHATDGYPELLDALPVAAKSYKRLGVVIDADLDPDSRWTQVAGAARSVGIELPSVPTSAGTIVEGMAENWRIGIWLMPDNNNTGTLETFLARLVPSNDLCWPHAESATREAQRLQARFPEKYFSKAQIHTWLAWQEEPGQPYGTAITARCFRTDTTEANSFVAWFKRLFID